MQGYVHVGASWTKSVKTLFTFQLINSIELHYTLMVENGMTRTSSATCRFLQEIMDRALEVYAHTSYNLMHLDKSSIVTKNSGGVWRRVSNLHLHGYTVKTKDLFYFKFPQHSLTSAVTLSFSLKERGKSTVLLEWL